MEIVTENATSLAWMGDAIMSLKVREHLLKKGYRSPMKLQKMNSVFNSAVGQASILKRMEEEDYFTEDEKIILKRGRNATVHTKAKNADMATYLKSTSLEALLGYLYLYDHEERLEQMLQKIVDIGDELL